MSLFSSLFATDLIFIKRPQTLSASTSDKTYTISAVGPKGTTIRIYKQVPGTDYCQLVKAEQEIGASGLYSSAQGTFGSLRLTDISAIANWDTSSAVSFRYMFDDCVWLFDLSPLANWDMSHGEMKLMFNDDDVYYSSLLGKRVYYHGVYGDTYYEDYQGCKR